jgi:hypothetical protein
LRHIEPYNYGGSRNFMAKFDRTFLSHSSTFRWQRSLTPVDVERLCRWKGKLKRGWSNKSRKAAVDSVGNRRPNTEDEYEMISIFLWSGVCNMILHPHFW